MIGEQSGPEKHLDKQWRGRTVFKIKSGVKLPEEMSTVKSSSKLPRISDPSDEVKPEHLPAGEISEKPKSSSSTDEADKSRGPDSSGPKRRLSQKTTAVAKNDYDEFTDDFERELDKAVEMELGKSDKSKDRRPKGDDVDMAPSSDDERWEKVSKKPGNESLEPRRISVPLPGSEAQALTPAYRKMIKRLDDKVELYKLHVKHYHMSPTQFRCRTSMLNLPDRIYQKYEEVYNKCRVCSMSVAPPPRAKISGIRASVFGDVIFVDHCEIELNKEEVCRTSCFETVQQTYCGLWLRNHSIRKKLWYIFENGMNKTIAFQRPLLEMKPSSQMSSMNTASSMELRHYLVDQGHHGQTELRQQ